MTREEFKEREDHPAIGKGDSAGRSDEFTELKGSIVSTEVTERGIIISIRIWRPDKPWHPRNFDNHTYPIDTWDEDKLWELSNDGKENVAVAAMKRLEALRKYKADMKTWERKIHTIKSLGPTRDIILKIQEEE